MSVTTEKLTDYLNEKCNATTKQEIETWLGENNKNRIYLNELRAYWNATKQHSVQFDVEKGFTSLSDKIQQQQRELQ